MPKRRNNKHQWQAAERDREAHRGSRQAKPTHTQLSAEQHGQLRILQRIAGYFKDPMFPTTIAIGGVTYPVAERWSEKEFAQVPHELKSGSEISHPNPQAADLGYLVLEPVVMERVLREAIPLINAMEQENVANKEKLKSLYDDTAMRLPDARIAKLRALHEQCDNLVHGRPASSLPQIPPDPPAAHSRRGRG